MKSVWINISPNMIEWIKSNKIINHLPCCGIFLMCSTHSTFNRTFKVYFRANLHFPQFGYLLNNWMNIWNQILILGPLRHLIEKSKSIEHPYLQRTLLPQLICSNRTKEATTQDHRRAAKIALMPQSLSPTFLTKTKVAAISLHHFYQNKDHV